MFKEVAVSARIRGHYRIDSAGRVEPMTDVNQAALRFHTMPPALPNQRHARAVRLSIIGFVSAVLTVGTLLALPQIQRAITSAQYAQIATIRRMHGHHMHDAADRFLRHDGHGQDGR
jgi:hypothetical protein